VRQTIIKVNLGAFHLFVYSIKKFLIKMRSTKKHFVCVVQPVTSI